MNAAKRRGEGGCNTLGSSIATEDQRFGGRGGQAQSLAGHFTGSTDKAVRSGSVTAKRLCVAVPIRLKGRGEIGLYKKRAWFSALR